MNERAQDNPYVERWLWCVFAMVCLMILVGGTTRLTGSGLSMVEWRPLMGTLPPLTDAEWSRVFEIYQASPQYQTVNQWMTMSDFKQIFFWEYLHRLIGRLIGLVFFLPMLFLWVKGHLVGKQRIRAMVAFVLGGGQGVLGWYMVKSGLVDIPAVSHYRLAAHLSLAFFLGAYVLWWILDLRSERTKQRVNRADCYIFLGVLTLQIIYGAFMAGTRAGYMYQTFPFLNGVPIPSGAWIDSMGMYNLSENRELLNIIHRWMGLLLTALGLIIFWRRRSQRTPIHLRRACYIFLSVLVLQVIAGIMTAAMHIPIAMGAAHQLLAFALLSVTIWVHHSHTNQPLTLAMSAPPAEVTDGVKPSNVQVPQT